MGGEPCSAVLPPLEWALILCNTLPAQCIIPPGHHCCALLSLSPARKPTQSLASSSRFVAVHWLRHYAPYLPVEAVPSLFSWPEVQEHDDKNFSLWNLGSRTSSCSCRKALTEAA